MGIRPSTKAEVTTTRLITLKPTVRKKLLTELHAYQDLKGRRDAIDAAMNAHKASIGALRESTGEDVLSLEGYKVTRVAAIRKVLNHKKLVELGCAVAWLEQATENKPSKPYEKIHCPGEKEPNDD